MRRLLIQALLVGALLLSGCSGSEPIELPEDPPDAVLLDAERVETPLDTVLIAVRQVSDVPISYERLFDVTDTGPDALIEHYDTALTAQGWERVAGSRGITGALGSSWERNGQDVLIALVSLEGRDVAAVFVSPG